MSNRIYGRDLSHHNWKQNLNLSDILYADGREAEFIILKATEGATYKDNRFTDWMNRIKDVAPSIVFGAYHYARPEKNNYVNEVDNFLLTVEPYIGDIILALDWEGLALTKGSQTWALDWLNSVYNNTGVKPLFYCQQSAVKNYHSIQLNDYGLWVARYSGNYGKIDPWEYPAMWQYSSTPYDMNVFYGTKEQLVKYTESKFWNKSVCPHGHTDCPFINRC